MSSNDDKGGIGGPIVGALAVAAAVFGGAHVASKMAINKYGEKAVKEWATGVGEHIGEKWLKQAPSKVKGDLSRMGPVRGLQGEAKEAALKNFSPMDTMREAGYI